MTKILLTADGGSRGNPGPSAYGFAIWNLSDVSGLNQVLGKDLGNFLDPNKIIYSEGQSVGITTNNQAEWKGVIAGLEYIAQHFNNSIELKIALDSELVVKQLLGIYKVKNADLIPLHKQAKLILAKISNYNIVHIYREFNKEADKLVNQTLDNPKLLSS